MSLIQNSKIITKRQIIMKTINNKKLCLLSALFALGSYSTVTANSLEKMADQWYIGGSVGFSSMNPDGSDTTWKTSDKKDIAKKLYIGTDVSRQIGLEAFWADFGEAKMKSTTGETGAIGYTAVGANVVYNPPIKFAGIRPLGKLGVAKFKNKDKGAVTSQQNNKLTIFGGLGAEYDLTRNVALRAEYEYYDKDISQINVGVNWSPRYRDHSFISQQQRVVQKPLPVAKKEPNVINIHVPPQPVPKPRIVYREAPKPKVIYKPAPKPRIVYRPAPKPPVAQYKEIHKTLSGGSHFDSGSAKLTYDGRNTLDRLAQDLNAFTLKSIRVVGHTDSVGTAQSNLSLSYARANSVAAYLASRGVNRQLINTQGLGETQPIADNRTHQGRAQNRRVEIRIKGSSRVRVR